MLNTYEYDNNEKYIKIFKLYGMYYVAGIKTINPNYNPVHIEGKSI